MRFKSRPKNSYQVFAVSGVNTISFGIHASEEAKRGLLGFAVERIDPKEKERYFMPGFKVFQSVLPSPTPSTLVSTWEHPIQSFVWDDFTAKPDREYQYLFYPIKGIPKNLDRSAKPIRIKVKTEPLFSNGPHDIFFNRGVASSQAYLNRFQSVSPDDPRLSEAERNERLQWLSRDLNKAILRFIQNAGPGDTLLGCFYEFRYLPVVQEIKAAMDRGVDVHLILDAKINEHTDKKGKFHESFPRMDNLRMLAQVGISVGENKNVTLRQARPNDIQHNKFLVLLRNGTPAEVWTGSTNISLGGFCGQTNVGHWVRDPQVASQFASYWNVLKTDPGALAGFKRQESRKANRALAKLIAGLHETPISTDLIPPGTTAVFSPRDGREVLDLYVRLVDSAKACSCITLAFGINDDFKQQLFNNTEMDHLVFMLLEKRDRHNPRRKAPFVPLTHAHNVYQAWGSFIKDPVYLWARETNAKLLGLNKHVVYIHSKFLLNDPLGSDPIVVTGSANFSRASTNNNDENMLLIRGDQRVADIYFTEFNRLFNHYYFRSVMEILKEKNQAEESTGEDGKPILSSEAEVFLKETADAWLPKYAPGKLRAKRLQLFTQMQGAKTL
jgi:phosphatidylserine/phosphatidylglycerophosphate/cardiolipin synthase-like enzyme